MILKYLKTLNSKSQVKLDDLTIEDLSIEIQYYLTNKNYTPYLIYKTCLRFFLNEISKKKKQLSLRLEPPDNSDEQNIINERLEKLKKIKLSMKYKAILADLIIGLTYEEVRKKYSLDSKQLRNIIYCIKNTLKYKTLK